MAPKASKKSNRKNKNAKKDGRPGMFENTTVKKPFEKRPFHAHNTPENLGSRAAKNTNEETSVPVDPESLQRHDTGVALLDPSNARTKVAADRMQTRKRRFVERVEQTARAEILNEQEAGGILAEDEGISTVQLRQVDIRDAVDMSSATKRFDLRLDTFGPYRFRYTPNGRHLLLGGRRGHVAALDWMTKTLAHEMNVMETVRDVQWLHVETMFAVAQKRYLRIYDKVGTELHCIKPMFDIQRLEFLPRHMLLVAGAQDSGLHYLDVCTGHMAKSFRARRGPLNVMAQNPANAIILTGSDRGVVSMWSPNATEPLVELFAHRAGINALSVDETGSYLATAGVDNCLKIFDLRMYKELHMASTPYAVQCLAFSQQRFLAASAGGLVRIYKNTHMKSSLKTPYLQHYCGSIVTDLHFCPYEDVLGVGHENGFSSLLIPGSGSPHFDGLRANPFETKKQRQEREIRMLLDKLQPEMITLNPSDINRVNRRNLAQTQDYQRNVLRVRPTQLKQLDGIIPPQPQPAPNVEELSKSKNS